MLFLIEKKSRPIRRYKFLKKMSVFLVFINVDSLTLNAFLEFAKIDRKKILTSGETQDKNRSHR